MTRSARAAMPADWQARAVDLGGQRPAAAVLDGILTGAATESTIIAIGNIHGQGEALLAQLDTVRGGRAPGEH
jgi:hypothetical protein